MDTKCQDAARAVRRAIGWNFANILHVFFANFTITLLREADNGEDLIFQTSGKWVKENRPYPPDSLEGYNELEEHLLYLRSCGCEKCLETLKLEALVAPYLDPEKRKVPGGDVLMLLHSVMAGCGSVAASRTSAPGLVEEFRPFLELLNDPELWRKSPEKK